MLSTIKLIGLYTSKIYLGWVILCISTYILEQLYEYATTRTKIIQLRSVVMNKSIIDENLNVYKINSSLHSKILKLKIDSYYKIKIYGIETPFTQLNVIDIC